MDDLKRLYADWACMLLECVHERGGDYERPVFGEGRYNVRLMLIGEAPGREEASAGRPFVGKAGLQLNLLLEEAGLKRDEVFITNAVKYRPITVNGTRVSNRTPMRAEWRAGLPLLQAEIDLIKPKLIATLGNTPLCALMALAKKDTCVRIGELHGQASELELGGKRRTLFPLYHPASVIYNPALLEALRADVRALGALLRERERIACEEG